MTAPELDPQTRPIPLVIPASYPSRVARDGRPQPGASFSPAGARARRSGTPRSRAGAARDRASDRAPLGTSRYRPAASSSPTERARTFSGTPCIDGPSRRASPRVQVFEGQGWISIPPRRDQRSEGAVDHDAAAKWISTRPPLKPSCPCASQHAPRYARSRSGGTGSRTTRRSGPRRSMGSPSS